LQPRCSNRDSNGLCFKLHNQSITISIWYKISLSDFHFRFNIKWTVYDGGVAWGCNSLVYCLVIIWIHYQSASPVHLRILKRGYEISTSAAIHSVCGLPTRHYFLNW
jgi:hypothetical protein